MQFDTYNQNAQNAFEDMCRLLFNRTFFDNKAHFTTSPNNPGIEVLPILHEGTNKRISFQSKYVASTSDAYAQFKNSAQKTVKYYSGQLDVLYLYCNKDLTVGSNPYNEIEGMLQAVNIKLILITNNAILDRVIEYPIVASIFFNAHNLSMDWFKLHIAATCDLLGPRYNHELNVATRTEESIALFAQTDEAIHRVNFVKVTTVQKIKQYQYRYTGSEQNLVGRLIEVICSLDDTTSSNMSQCLNWSAYLREKLSDEFAQLEISILEKKRILNELASKDDNDNSSERELRQSIHHLEWLLDVPSLLCFSETDNNLISRKVLVLKGDAGTGKSHLFASVAEKSIFNSNPALTLLAHTFSSSDPILTTLTTHLSLSYSVDELLNVIEGLGEVGNRCVVIYIDAINESATRNIWKTGLIQLISKINDYNHIRLAVSVRSGYEKDVFSDTFFSKIESGEIVNINHMGFRGNSVEALETFMNHYNIPFSPAYFLQHEMTNPLFLTLFCKSYSGEDYDLFTLFDEMIKRVGYEIQEAIGVEGLVNSFRNIVDALVQFMAEADISLIPKNEVLNLSFWETYGLSNSKMPFLSALEKSGIIISFNFSGSDKYSFGYNLLGDFLLAKYIIKKYSDKNTLLSHMKDTVLKITDGRILGDTNLFTIICGLYADKYNEECIGIIDSVTEVHDKYELAESYVRSFLWRKASTVDGKSFMDFVNTYRMRPDTVFHVFIANSTKENHPLNSVQLHAILLDKPLNHRDYIWTRYVNGLAYEEERLLQLVELFNKGKHLKDMSPNVYALILKLFAWLLTSSNRFIRDTVSKAMIELLKERFYMCKELLVEFETVNDPYVIQRLYGIVFGVCMKRSRRDEDDNDFKDLAIYVYETIFDQDVVYPNILLRDYARLIVERWIHEFPCFANEIDCCKIRPPYRSEAIPAVVKEEYYDKSIKDSGFNRIEMSMKTTNHGMYGDFGRYIFEAAVSDFESVDMDNLYHYAMQYIRDELGYLDDYFGNHDTSGLASESFDRMHNNKMERIGKKYQWIAMHNILARISDAHQIESWDKGIVPYEGAWNPYVRDFDPTLNKNFLLPPDLPQFNNGESYENEFISVVDKSKHDILAWAKIQGEFLSDHAKRLRIVDSTGQAWIVLNQHDKIKNVPADDYTAHGRQDVWVMSSGFFVKQSDYKGIFNDFEQRKTFNRVLSEPRSVYELFNREYTWSPGSMSFFGDVWEDYEIETGETIVEKHIGQRPIFNFPAKQNVDDDSTDDDSVLWDDFLVLEEDEWDDFLFIEEDEWETTRRVTKVIAQVMPTYSCVLWECEYDASQEESTAFYVPCKDIIDFLDLEQKEYDGYFYSKNDDSLVAYDYGLSMDGRGLVIRQDYLETYLVDKGLKMSWACTGEKNCYLNRDSGVRSKWRGLFSFEKGCVVGSLKATEVFAYPQ